MRLDEHGKSNGQNTVKPTRILFDICHPAHAHLFRNLILYLDGRGHEVVVVAREKDVTSKLLAHYGVEHVSLSRPGAGLHGLFIEVVRRTSAIMRMHRERRFDAAFGTSVSIGFLSLFAKTPSFNFNEDDDAAVPLYCWLAYPVADRIINPECLAFSRWERKRILYPSYHELAYLHPDNFVPDPDIPAKYSLVPGKYAVVRKSALTAHHDFGKKGLSGNVWKQAENLLDGLQLVVSKEGERSHAIDPWDMHHVLAHARLVVSDSQTMTAEAAVLGVPALRYNSFVGRIGYLEELEHKYGLTYGFPPGREKPFLDKLSELSAASGLKEIWRRRRKRMLADKIDLNRWMIEFCNKRVLGGNGEG